MSNNEKKIFKILISDENVTFRNVLASRLRLLEFNVEIALGGFHLLHILENDIDCSHMVILHEDMLDMSALEIISLVRTNKSQEELPIIFISQDQNEEKICDIMFNGANEYIIKTNNLKPIIECSKKYSVLLKNS